MVTSFQPAHPGQAISVVTYSCGRPLEAFIGIECIRPQARVSGCCRERQRVLCCRVSCGGTASLVARMQCWLRGAQEMRQCNSGCRVRTPGETAAFAQCRALLVDRNVVRRGWPTAVRS